MGRFNTVTFNGSAIPRPNDFAPQRVSIYAGEIVTCTGATIADEVGWKFGDMTLSWGYLSFAELNTLLGLHGDVLFGFTDQTGTAQSEHIRINSNVSVGHRWKDSGGNEVWTDIEMEIVFLDAHTYA